MKLLVLLALLGVAASADDPSPRSTVAAPGAVVLVHGGLPASLIEELEQVAPREEWLELSAGQVEARGSQLRRARVLRLSGGDLLDWWGALLPHGRPSPALDALAAAPTRGAWIVASEGAADLLAGAARVADQAWEDFPGGLPRERNPRRRHGGSRLLGGLGLAGDLLVAGDLDEAREALLEGDVERVLVPLGPLAWVWRGGRGTLLADGEGPAALWLDARGARRLGPALRDVALVRLRGGEAVRPPREAPGLELGPGEDPPTAGDAWRLVLRP